MNVSDQPQLPGLPWKGPDDVGGDLAAVELTRLRRYGLPVQPYLVEPAGVDRSAVGELRVAQVRLWIPPADLAQRRNIGHLDIDVTCLPFHSQNVTRDDASSGRVRASR